MGTLNLDRTPQPLFPAGQGSVLLVNNDETTTVYVDNNKSVTTSSVPLPPQGQITVDGTVQWWGATLSPSVTELVVAPGGTQWNNPVGVQIALSALGLAKDSTVNNVHEDLALGTNPYLGGSATGALTASAGKSIAEDMLAANSGVTTELAGLLQPNLEVTTATLSAPGSATILTPATNRRIWCIVINGDVAGTPSASGLATWKVTDANGDITIELVMRINSGLAVNRGFTQQMSPPVPLPIAALDTLSLAVACPAGPTAVGSAVVFSSS